ncbi:MAG: nuclear transport factor 2 family protein [Alcanivoracaceae bacterium]|jgi:hypothetical protein|nr:nuclear transport factor 2 family protein [Alcanivoracaceae bacterium]
MTEQELACAYVRAFSEGDLDGLAAVLTEDFCIRGPLYTFTDRAAFLQRLRELNAPKAAFDIVHCQGGNNSASVFFHYRLGALELLMAMHLQIRDGRISEALLVFDTARLPGRRD